MFCKVELYIVRWDPSWPERLFLHFFRKLFQTRLCKDIIYYFAQKRSFLQRRKSVCKRSCTICGTRPPQGPACVRLRYRIFAKRFEKQRKNLNFRKDHLVYFFFGANREDAKKKDIQGHPYENLSFFCCFSIIFAKIPNRSLTQAGPWGGRIPRTVQDLLHTLFRRCKKDLFWAK